MSEEQDVPKRGMRWGLPASALLHVLVAVLLLLKLPATEQQPPKEETVKVDIVPQDEAPPPPQEKPAEEPPAPPPPPPPPAQQEQAKVEPPPKVPIPTLRPVFQFGQKDEGPKKEDGNAAEGRTDDADTKPDEKPDAPEAKPAPEVKTADAAPEQPKDDVAGVPDILKALEQESADKADDVGKPEEKTATAPEPAKAEQLTAARKIFSDTALGGQAAVLAMGDLPRDQRISQLCATELREQLRHATPKYSPELLPAFRLRFGNVLDVPKAAFRTRRDWYDLSFRCEVDEPATRVLSFAFKVGDRVPQSEWKARGFPEN